MLAREDGTIEVRAYRQWEHLHEKHGVQATLLFPSGESAAELGNFTGSLPEGSEGSEQFFATVIPETVTSKVGEPVPEAWGKRR